MKRVKFLLLLTAFAALSFTACKDKESGPDQKTVNKLVTIKTQGDGFYGLTDSDEKIFVGEGSLVAGYTPVDGKRARIFFEPLDVPVTGYAINAKVSSIVDYPTRDVVLLTDPAKDTYGKDYILIRQAFIGGGYFNLEYDADYRGELDMVDNQVEPVEEKAGYISLELRYSISKDRMSVTKPVKMACFSLDLYNPALVPGCKGLYIRFTTAMGDYDYLTVDLPGSGTGK